MRIVVLDGRTLNPGDNPWDPVGRLGELTVYDRTDEGDIAARAADAEILLTNKTPLSRRTLAELGQLRMISVLATGYDVVDVAAARQRGVTVCNVPEYATDSVAQHTFALLLALCHHVGDHDQAVRSGQWAREGSFCFWNSPLVELAGMSMGIVGFGRIGRRVGCLARALGMDVLVYDTRPGETPQWPGFAWVSLETLFERADVVSLHCPQTADNVGMVGRELLARMKPSAFLINTARGALVDEAAVAEALNAGRLAGAGLDVVSAEPIRPDNPLLSARNCVLTPHIAWATLAARRRLMRATGENIAGFLSGQPVNVVS